MQRWIMAIDSDVEDDEWPDWLPKNQPEEEWMDDEPDVEYGYKGTRRFATTETEWAGTK
jgi:hypothetical protein